VASADKTYVDPSALRRLYVHDQRSRAFCAWIARMRGALPLTLHGKAEIVNSIELAVFRRDITAAIAEGALADLASDLTEGRLALADVPWRRTLDRAAELSRVYTPRLGTRFSGAFSMIRSRLFLGSGLYS
jgi:hypothetical protein